MQPNERPARAGLQLLIRKSDDAGAGYEIRTVHSSQAFLRMRPVRAAIRAVEENVVDEAAGKVHVLRLEGAGLVTAQYLRLNERERFIWQHVDGDHTIQDIAAALFFRFGSLDVRDIRSFLHRARQAGLIAMQAETPLRQRAVARGGALGRLLDRLPRLERRWRDVDAGFARAHVLFGWLLSRPANVLLAVLAGAGAAVYARYRFSGQLGEAAWPFFVDIALWIVILLTSMALHELAHGLLTKAHGRKVKAVGMELLDSIVPSFYVDITDMWMSTQLGRIEVTLAGPCTNLLLGGLAALTAGAAQALGAPAALGEVLSLCADANYALAIYTLWPFFGLREDGYELLTDVLRVPALRPRAVHVLREWADRSLPREPDLHLRGAAVIYLAGVLATWIGLLVAFLTVVSRFVGG